MRALVLYESMFGNTQQLAAAIAEGLTPGWSVEVTEVGTAAPIPLDDVDLLVIGGPTHAFGLSRGSTRLSAAGQSRGPLVSANGGIREWLDALPHARPGQWVATFDTSLKKWWLPGSAARSAARRLRHLGYRLAAPPQSFFVSGTLGPLRDGELDRGRRWSESLGAALIPSQRLRRWVDPEGVEHEDPSGGRRA